LTRDNRLEVLSFMIRVIVILKLFRGQDVPHLFSGHDMGVGEILIRSHFHPLLHRAKVRELVASPPQLRIFPLDKVFDMQAFRAEMLRDCPRIASKFTLLMQGDENAWTLEAQWWISEGM
jgi:hypothetical protein